MQNRIIKAREAMPRSCDALFITSHISRLYLSGADTSAGVILITKEKAFFFTDFRYYERVKKEAGFFEIFDSAETKIGDILKSEKIKSLGFEDRKVTVFELQKLKEKYRSVSFVPIGDLIEKIRAVKEPLEIEAIKTAQRIAEKSLFETLKIIKEGISEKELADFLVSRMKENGADDEFFKTIVLAGENTSMPHGVPGERKVEKGDFILFDFGAKIENYGSDMTRTVAFGEPTQKMRQVYELVRMSQDEAKKAIKVDVIGKEVDRASRDFLAENGYKKEFGHGLGHSLGLEVHEAPSFSQGCEEKIKSGCVITVEPGVYLSGEFGVRIEDMVLVTENGYENLTSFPKDLIIL